jgi:PII-like signaling protein
VTADCLKLTSYFGERHRTGPAFTANALIELYGRHEIAASILLRGAEGFGLKHHLRTDRSLTLSEDTDDHGMALWHKLMVHTSEAVQHHGEPIHRAIVRRLRSAGLSGATTQRGVWGFHGDHAPHGDRLLQLGRHVPAVTVVIDSPERISAAFSVIDDLTRERGLVTSETIPAMRASAGDRQRGGTRLATHHLPYLWDPGRGNGPWDVRRRAGS